MSILNGTLHIQEDDRYCQIQIRKAYAAKITFRGITPKGPLGDASIVAPRTQGDHYLTLLKTSAIYESISDLIRFKPSASNPTFTTVQKNFNGNIVGFFRRRPFEVILDTPTPPYGMDSYLYDLDTHRLVFLGGNCGSYIRPKPAFRQQYPATLIRQRLTQHNGNRLETEQQTFEMVTVRTDATCFRELTTPSEVDTLVGPMYRKILHLCHEDGFSGGGLSFSHQAECALIWDIFLTHNAPNGSGVEADEPKEWIYIGANGIREKTIKAWQDIIWVGWSSDNRYLIGQRTVVSYRHKWNTPPVIALDPTTWHETILYQPPPGFVLRGFQPL